MQRVKESHGSAGVVVCVTPVMDTSSPVDFAHLMAGRGPFPEPRAPELSWILNPADDAAIHMAAKLPAGEKRMLAMYVGPASGEAALRDAIAYGASDALRLELPPQVSLDAASVAEALASCLQNGSPEWVFCGQSTLDWDTGLVGPMLAELLGWPFLDGIIRFDPDLTGGIRCTRVAGKSVQETVLVKPPAVLAVSPMAYQPQIPPVRLRMKAQRAVIPVQPAQPTGALGRPNSQEARRPGPRPKDSLPSSFNTLSAGERMAMLLGAGQPARTARRIVEGDAPTLARELMDLLQRAECIRLSTANE